MDILHLIDRLEELVAEARRMPIGQGVVIDRRRLLEMVDQMRSSVPWEVKEAREATAHREALLEEARREGEGIIARAELEAQAKLDEMELVQAAQREAADVTRKAEDRAQQIMDDAQVQVQSRMRQAEAAANNQMDEADRYALEMLKRLDAQLMAFGNTVRAGINSLEERVGETQGFREEEAQHDEDYRTTQAQSGYRDEEPRQTYRDDPRGYRDEDTRRYQDEDDDYEP